MVSTRSPFLDVLHPELRIQIYSYLLVSPHPIRSKYGSQAEDCKPNLHPAILRTNRQIHAEASTILYGMNKFCISSVPPSTLPCSKGVLLGEDEEYEEEASGAFAPPLQLHYLPLVRHLEVDLLYHPRLVRVLSTKNGWVPVSPGAQRYISTLAVVLSTVSSTLSTLSLSADTRPYSLPSTPAPSPDLDTEAAVPYFSETPTTCECATPDCPSTPTTEISAQTLDQQALRTGFYMADTVPAFKSAIASLQRVTRVPLRIRFENFESEHEVGRDLVVERSLLGFFNEMWRKRDEIWVGELLGDEVGVQREEREGRKERGKEDEGVDGEEEEEVWRRGSVEVCF